MILRINIFLLIQNESLKFVIDLFQGDSRGDIEVSVYTVLHFKVWSYLDQLANRFSKTVACKFGMKKRSTMIKEMKG